MASTASRADVRTVAIVCIATLLAASDVYAQATRRPEAPSRGAMAAPALAHSDYTAAIAHGRTVLQALVDAKRLPGVAVAVGVNGTLVWSEGFGLADIERRVPVDRGTLFGIGSISKTFTMAAVMRLVDTGVLELDAPIEQYLPDFPHRGRGITLRHLAVHQSGLSDEFAAAHYQTARHFPTIESAYDEIRNERLKHEPGSQHEYATGLYTIIGHALEKATRRSYLDVMQNTVFTPAGMSGVVPNDRTRSIPRRVGFYIQNDNNAFEPAPFYDPSFKLPGAGFLATADDVARFGMALLDPRFLSDRARAEMFRPVPLRDGTATEFALGLRFAQQDRRILLHLPGGGLGISAWLYIYPVEGLVIALLSNVPTGPVGGRTHREIAARFLPTS